MSMNWEGRFHPGCSKSIVAHDSDNMGQAPMFTGRLIESLLAVNEISFSKAKMEQLLLDDPFVFAPSAWAQNLKKVG